MGVHGKADRKRSLLRLPPPSAEVVVLLLFLGASCLWRIGLVSIETLNPDEVSLVGGAFRVQAGLVTYVDYMEVHAPFLYKVYAPLVRWFGETPLYLDSFRWLHALLALILHLILFFVVMHRYGALTALWTVCILNTFLFFIHRTVHVRLDTPALVLFLASICLLTYRGGGVFDLRRLALGAFGMAVAFSTHATIAFSISAVYLWLFLESPREGSFLSRWKRVLFCGSVFVVSYGLLSFLLFGTRTTDALLSFYRSFSLDALFMHAYEPDTGKILHAMVLSSFPSWVLLGWGVLAFNVRWLAGRLANPYTRLFVLLTDMGIVFLLIRKHSFEQHYIQLVIFGSVLTALLLLEWKRRVELRWGKDRGRRAGLLMAVMLTCSGLATGSWSHLNAMNRDAGEMHRAEDVRSHFSSPLGSLNAEALRAYLREHPRYKEPFEHRTKRQREAQIRFILENSSEDQAVYSDWLNPPFRELPARYCYGFITSIFYRSQQLRASPEHIRFVHRYDPSYSARDNTEPDHMIRLFETATPQLILLEGSAARLFTTSDRFHHWVATRYTFTLEQESGSVFAVRAPP